MKTKKIRKSPKDKKFDDGRKPKVTPNSICAECGRKISQQEEQRNEGLCNDCFNNIMY